MHQNVEEANLVPIDSGRDGYIARHSPSPQPQAPTHTGYWGGGGLKKRKKSPQGTYCTVQRGGVCEKVVNPITMNCLSYLLSGLFLMRAAGAPQAPHRRGAALHGMGKDGG